MGRAWVVVGLGFGDEGKGHIVDHLCRSNPGAAVVRYNGGPQAAHNVVLEDGTHHTFAQFGSGTLRGAKTHLSRFMLINPFNLMKENDHLRELGHYAALENLTIDEKAMVITPYHIAANRWAERKRGTNRHGSCGQGIGEAEKMRLYAPDLAIHAKDLKYRTLVRDKLEAQKHAYEFKLETAMHVRPAAEVASEFADIAMGLNVVGGGYEHELARQHDLVFEGAQGVLLDEWRGFHPYTTWSTTTSDNAGVLIDAKTDVEWIGVLRCYHTRHGPGPFPTWASTSLELMEEHNDFGEYQREFRVGHFDAVLANYALQCDGRITSLALTHLDRWHNRVRICNEYADSELQNRLASGARNHITRDLKAQEWLTNLLLHAHPRFEAQRQHEEDNTARILELLDLPATMLSYGPRTDDIVDQKAGVHG